MGSEIATHQFDPPSCYIHHAMVVLRLTSFSSCIYLSEKGGVDEGDYGNQSIEHKEVIMEIRNLLGAAVLAVMALPASANTSTITVSENTPTQFFSPGFLVGNGWHDTVTFEGLAAGTYNIDLGFTGLKINISSLTLNGQSLTPSAGAPGVSLFSFTNVASSPFTLEIFGSTPIGKIGTYAGVFSAVAAVPEPETYTLALAALGIGVFIRRKSKNMSSDLQAA
jgi:hypothetical protein